MKRSVKNKKVNSDDEKKFKLKKYINHVKIVNNNVYIMLKSKKFHTRQAWIVPMILRNEIIKGCHSSPYSGHGGIFKTTYRIYEHYWWPGSNKDIVKFVNNCATCQKAKGNKTLIKTQPLAIPQKQNERVHMDLFGPLKTSSSGKKYVCVITDAFTKYTEIVPIDNKNSETVAKAFYEGWIANHGMCDQLVTDNGTEFTNEVLKDLCKLMNIEKIYTSAYNPRANSSAESFNRVIIKYMKTQLDNNTLDWELILPALKIAYNTSVHEGTLRSPFFLTYFHDPKMPFFDLEKPKTFYKTNYATSQFQQMEKVYKDINQNLIRQREKNVKFDTNKEEKLIKTGDQVYVSDKEITKPGINNKFKLLWKGPYLVTRMKNANVEIRQDGKTVTVHLNRVKKAIIDDALLHDQKPVSFPPEREQKPKSGELTTNGEETASAGGEESKCTSEESKSASECKNASHGKRRAKSTADTGERRVTRSMTRGKDQVSAMDAVIAAEPFNVQPTPQEIQRTKYLLSVVERKLRSINRRIKARNERMVQEKRQRKVIIDDDDDLEGLIFEMEQNMNHGNAGDESESGSESGTETDYEDMPDLETPPPELEQPPPEMDHQDEEMPVLDYYPQNKVTAPVWVPPGEHEPEQDEDPLKEENVVIYEESSEDEMDEMFVSVDESFKDTSTKKRSRSESPKSERKQKIFIQEQKEKVFIKEDNYDERNAPGTSTGGATVPEPRQALEETKGLPQLRDKLFKPRETRSNSKAPNLPWMFEKPKKK